jgi:hypothetical protein
MGDLLCKYFEHQWLRNTNPHSKYEGKYIGYMIPTVADPLAPKERRAHKRYVKRLHQQRQAETRRTIQAMFEWPWCGTQNRPVELAFGMYKEENLVAAAWFCPDCAKLAEGDHVNTALLRAKERFKEVVHRNDGGEFAKMSLADLNVLLDGGHHGWWRMNADREACIRGAIKAKTVRGQVTMATSSPGWPAPAQASPGYASPKYTASKMRLCGRCLEPLSEGSSLCPRCLEQSWSVVQKNFGQEHSTLGALGTGPVGGLRGGKTIQQDRELLGKMGLNELERFILTKRFYTPPASTELPTLFEK